MGQSEPLSRIDRLVDFAQFAALCEALPRKRRAKLLARVLAIAADWERQTEVIDLSARRLQSGSQDELRAAAARLRLAVEALDCGRHLG